MIDKIVFAFGPPKCGMKAAGQTLQRKHGWSHVCMRRTLLKLSEVYMLHDLPELVDSGQPIPPDVAYAAFVARMLECSRIDSGKTLYFHGAFSGAEHVGAIIKHARRFARVVEVVEFNVKYDIALERMLKSDSDYFKSEENAKKALDLFVKELPRLQAAVMAAKKTHPSLVNREIDADHPTEFVVTQILRGVRKVPA